MFHCLLHLISLSRSTRTAISLLEHFTHENDKKMTNLEGLAESSAVWTVPQWTISIRRSTETPSTWLESSEFTNLKDIMFFKTLISFDDYFTFNSNNTRSHSGSLMNKSSVITALWYCSSFFANIVFLWNCYQPLYVI